MKLAIALGLLVLPLSAFAGLPSVGGEKPPADALRVVIDRRGAVRSTDLRKELRALANSRPMQGDMVSEGDLVLVADADAPLRAVADVLSLSVGMRLDNPDSGHSGMTWRIWAAVREKDGKPAAVKMFLPVRPFGEFSLPAAKRSAVLVCGGDRPYRVIPYAKAVEVLGVCQPTPPDGEPAVPVLKAGGDALDLKGLLERVGDDRDGAILFFCGEGGRWGDLVAAHRALDPGGVLRLGGRGFPHMERYDEWQDRNRRRFLPAGADDLPELSPDEWGLTATLFETGFRVGDTKVDAKDLAKTLAKEADVAPRDDEGRSRRGLVLYADADVPFSRVRAFLEAALGKPARFGAVDLALAGKNGIVRVRAVPADANPLPAIASDATFGEAAPKLPPVFALR